ncbi:MAG: cytochrome c oxidase assembly factor Coa1 family protein [Planctomycetota bacterium]
MSEEVVEKHNWWIRNWKWFVPVSILTAIIILCLICFAFVYFIFGIIKSTDAYKTSLKYAQENEEVIKTFGGKIEPKWYVIGSVRTVGLGGHASLQIPVSYGNKSGNVYVEADKETGVWTIKKLIVQADDTGKRLTLIDWGVKCDSNENQTAETIVVNPTDYLPLKIGNKWVYKVTSHGGIGRKEEEASEIIYTVTSTQKYNGEECFVIEGQRKEANPQPIFYKATLDGIISYHGIRGGNAIDFDSPFVDIKNPLKIGEAWTGKGNLGNLEFNFSTIFTKQEEIITPAGKFQCIKIERVCRFGNTESKDIYWYAKNVGLVKMISCSYGTPTFGISGGEDVEELISFQVN